VLAHRTVASFWTAYDALPAEVQLKADQQFALLKIDPRHPSLHFKKVGASGVREVWSARVSLRYRALAVQRQDAFVWFWIGDHQAYDRMIGSA
jgi:hypothetical protein